MWITNIAQYVFKWTVPFYSYVYKEYNKKKIEKIQRPNDSFYYFNLWFTYEKDMKNNMISDHSQLALLLFS